MASLFLDEPGLHLCLTHQRLRLERDDQELAEVRLQDVERLVICDHASVTSAALTGCLRHGIPVAFISRGGDLLGRLVPAAEGPDGELRRGQWALSQATDGGLTLARRCVDAKLAGLSYRLRRRQTAHPAVAEAIGLIDRARPALAGARDLAGLLGCEGAATRAYYGCWPHLIREPWSFTTRQRRPPPDPVNALLGFLGALVENEVSCAVAGAGLDPDLGFLHVVTRRRASLCLDLLEEFRPLAVDAVTLRLLNRRQLSPDQFEPGRDGGVWLTEAGRGIVFAELERHWDQTVARRGEPSLSWREQLRRQAVALAQDIRALTAGEPLGHYCPIADDLR